MVEIREISLELDPGVVAANFIGWLGQKGQVAIGEKTTLAPSHHSLRSLRGETQAVEMSVALNGIQIGYLQLYENPSAIRFIGHREECMDIPYERTTRPGEATHERIIREMGLTYTTEPYMGNSGLVGRIDGHKRIHFP